MTIEQSISPNRYFLMGNAMVAIMLFHQHWLKNSVFFDIFHQYGHWGVDIFLLVSGYGIANSLSKNNIQTFYKNRFKRILPTCLLVGIISTILYFIWFQQKNKV